jgi:omega-amidase
MSTLNVSLIQADLHWENTDANTAMIERSIAALSTTDLIVIPEMWNTGFSSKSASLSQAMDGPAVRSMQGWAKASNAVIAGSLMIHEDGKYYNRMLWVRPDGSMSSYDKRHLFRMAGEHEHFEAGKERVIVEYKGWRIMLQICYDLRFPVFARNQYHEGTYDYDLIIYVANWPSPRHHAWETLLKARAMENLSYCIGVNRVGTDANGFGYKGGSALLDFMGNPLAEGEGSISVIEADLSLSALRAFREKFPTGMDADGFELKG